MASLDLVVPKLGESITEAVIAKWLKQVGETIQADEPVVDLETDKVSVALPAPASGGPAEQKLGARLRGPGRAEVRRRRDGEDRRRQRHHRARSGDRHQARRRRGASATAAA